MIAPRPEKSRKCELVHTILAVSGEFWAHLKIKGAQGRAGATGRARYAPAGGYSGSRLYPAAPRRRERELCRAEGASERGRRTANRRIRRKHLQGDHRDSPR